jgi:hypothetical protein
MDHKQNSRYYKKNFTSQKLVHMSLECKENSMERNQLDNNREKKSDSKLQQQELETSKRF